MNSKRFFYVSASLFLLAATVSLGTQYVHAQGNVQLVDVNEDRGWAGIDTLRRVILSGGTVLSTCPGPGTPVAIRRVGYSPGPLGGSSGLVFLDNGSVWEFNQTGTGPFTWTLTGSFFGGTTDARQPPASKSWSAVKDAFRK